MMYVPAAIASFLVTMSMATSIMSVGASGVRHRVSVTEDNIKFNIVYFDDGRNRPYRVVFMGNVRNTFDFDATGIVEILRIGTEKYKVEYDEDTYRATLTSPSWRELSQKEWEEDGLTFGNRTVPMGPTRRLYSCGDCEETWDAICDAGVPSVCRFVGAGFPFSAEAGASIEVLCNTFGNACDDSTGDEVCEGQCVRDGDDDDDNVQGGGRNACLDPDSDQYKCAFTGLNSMRLEECGLVDNDLPYLPACFETFGKTNLKELYFSYFVTPTVNALSTFPEDTFAGLTELTHLGLGFLGLTNLPANLFSGLVSVTQLALYHNNLTALPSGIFSDLESVTFIYLYENSLVTLPDGLFEGCHSLKIVNLDENDLVGFPAAVFAGMDGVSVSLHMRSNRLTTLPDGLFNDIARVDVLTLEGNAGLQCIPAV
eukprot:jgi/Undpi1/6995/HiC_scaffold_21.g09469.m1